MKKCRTEYDGLQDSISRETSTKEFDVGLTVQSERDEADINVIVKRFGVTGHMPENVRVPLYGDFVDAGDYRGAVEAVQAADRSFMAMPADFRGSLGNDAHRFIDWCEARNDDGSLTNLDRMRELGLAVPKEVVVEPKPVKVEVINSVRAPTPSPSPA